MILIFRIQVDKQIVVKLNLLQTSLVVLVDDKRLLAIHFQALNFGLYVCFADVHNLLSQTYLL